MGIHNRGGSSRVISLFIVNSSHSNEQLESLSILCYRYNLEVLEKLLRYLPKSSVRTQKPYKDGVNGEVEKLTLSHNHPLHSHAEERVTDKALNENTFSDVCAGSPTEVVSDEGANDEFEKRQDDELQQKPPAFEKASGTDHPHIPVSLPGASLRRMGLLEREKDFLKHLVKVSLRFSKTVFKTVSKTLLICLSEDTSAVIPAAKLSNEMDFVNRLSKDQQAQYAPLENKTSLRNTRALPQQIPRTQKRFGSPALPPVRHGGAPLLNSKSDLRESSSKNNKRGRKLVVPIIRKYRYPDPTSRSCSQV